MADDIELRRTYRFAVPRLAARLEPGSLVHTASQVFEVASIAMDEPSPQFPDGCVRAEVGGGRQMHWAVGRQLARVVGPAERARYDEWRVSGREG